MTNTPAPLHPQEQERLAAIASYNIVDTPPEVVFDDIVRLASQICNVPVSLITLVTEDRQWFKAAFGVDVTETPREIAFCSHSILQEGLFEVHDATKDDRFKDNPLVTGDYNVRFYAGAVLRTADNLPLGTLCVLDTKPGQLTDEQRFALKTLSSQVMTQFEMRRTVIEHDRARRVYETILKNTPDLVYVIGTDKRFRFANDALLKMWGKTAEESANKTLLELGYEPWHAEMHEREIDEIILTKKSIKAEVPFNGTNGRRIYEYIFSPILAADDSVEGIAGTTRDVTERHELIAQLEQARALAEDANSAKSDFLANMSHEIRTPMNAVVGLANILARSKPLTPIQLKYIDTLRSSADGLLVLINDLLDLSKIESRNMELESIPFNAAVILREIGDLLDVKAKEKSISLTVDAKRIEDITFVGDPNRLRQIILNVVGNAVKFTEQGSVHISAGSCAADDNPEVEVLAIRVRDTGIGIAAEQQESIFEKFAQANTAISRKYGGTGLGLSITKNLIEAMGGTLSVQSKLGEGSTFSIQLPLQVACSSGERVCYNSDGTVKADVGPAEAHKMNVLLVEDYEPNVIVASSFIEEFGYNCVVANNGREAIEKVKTGNFMAAFMDVQMSEMNGLQATAIIREHETQFAKPRLTVIGMTAHVLAGDRERCLAAGMDGYISKPFDPELLQSTLADIKLKLSA